MIGSPGSRTRLAGACLAAMALPALVGPVADRLIGEKAGEPLVDYVGEAGLFLAAGAISFLLLFVPLAMWLGRRRPLTLLGAILLGGVTGPGPLGWFLIVVKARGGDLYGATSLLSLTAMLGALGGAVFWLIALGPRARVLADPNAGATSPS